MARPVSRGDDRASKKSHVVRPRFAPRSVSSRASHFRLDSARVRLLFLVTVKTTPTRPRKSATIPNSRWLAYATAGAASAFAAANSAEGTIHYSGPINQVFNSCAKTATFQLDRPGDFIHLRHTQLGCSSYNGTGLFNVGALAGASIAAFYSSKGNIISASNLKRGQVISNRPFLPGQLKSAVLGAEQHGQFNGPGVGYIGFKFNSGSGDQYGWVRIQTADRGRATLSYCAITPMATSVTVSEPA